jgi:hypothetical protein
MRGLLAVWIRWFPGRISVFNRNGGFTSHSLTAFAARYHKQLTLLSKFNPDAVLHSPPPKRYKKQMGRSRIVGKRLPSPAIAVAKTVRRHRLTVCRYGGRTRRIEIVSEVGHWYRQGEGVVPVRRGYVRDLSGTHREEYFYSSDASMTPRQIIESFVGRWGIEVTFAEMRAHPGSEKSRGRCRQTVLRVEPCLFCLYSLIACWFANLPVGHNREIHVPWLGKTSLTFSAALAAVRSNQWRQQLFQRAGKSRPADKRTTLAKNAKIRLLALAT